MRTWKLSLAATVMVALPWGMGTAAAESGEADTAGTLAPAGSLAEARSSHPATLLTATLLPDGRVLVSGGRGADDIVPAPEVWDPQSHPFTASGAPTSVRPGVTYAPLPDGRILLVGGRDAEDESLPSAEVWDPTAGTFEPVGPMAEARSLPGVTLLPDGRVLVFGGWGDDEDRLTSATETLTRTSPAG